MWYPRPETGIFLMEVSELIFLFTFQASTISNKCFGWKIRWWLWRRLSILSIGERPLGLLLRASFMSQDTWEHNRCLVRVSKRFYRASSVVSNPTSSFRSPAIVVEFIRTNQQRKDRWRSKVCASFQMQNHSMVNQKITTTRISGSQTEFSKDWNSDHKCL